MEDNTEIDRDHSRPLDVHRWSDHPEATKLRDLIWNQYFKEKFQIDGKGNKPKSAPEKQFKVLLLDLYVAWLNDPQLSIGVAMSKSGYKQNSRYNALFISAKIIEIINHAHSMGLVYKKTGSEFSGKTTRIRASEKLAAYFKKAKLSLFDMTQEYSKREVIILSKSDFIKGKKKRKEVDYLDTDLKSITSMRQQLHNYNALIWRTYVDIPTLEKPIIKQPYWDAKAGETKTKRVRLTQIDKFVRRIFYRGDWELGGRFHGGWWQSINQDWRKKIYINDNSTVEIDYSGLHVNLLYGLKGLQPPLEDHYKLKYLLPGFTINEQRQIVKGIVLKAINANSFKAACAAFRQQEEIGSREKALKNIELERLLDAFKKKHPNIQEALCSDKGVELMGIDGRVTAKLIEYFTSRNIPVLTIHDSYIVQNQHSGKLRSIMTEIVTEELNGFKINIDQEGVGIDQIQAFKNMDRSNSTSYTYDAVVSYEKSNEYKKRKKIHNDWLRSL